MAQFVQQGRSLFQVGCIEALGEPAVDFGQHRPCLVAAIGVK